jgi:RNA polymerase sigma-70 factor, ECF subfamily
MLYSYDQYSSKDLPSISISDDITDAQLMKRIQDGDEEALATLYHRHRALLRAIAGRILNNDHDVDDLLQECLLELWRHAADYREEKGCALAWIITVVRRRSIDRVRRQATYGRVQDCFREEMNARREEIATGADEEVDQNDRAKAVMQLIGRLPEPQQQAVQLAFYRGMSQRQIAAHTGMPLGTIKTRLELALRKLRAAAIAFGELHENIQPAPAMAKT